ncbi:hypothetical protein [Parapedobacter soli]|uniref:hypothetical protein n=1 Tax=Parapedobacter soli TaxID=416955 RepID=UPI0021C9FBBF|nr:hypothetical protein [Parapedobacter soli]
MQNLANQFLNEWLWPAFMVLVLTVILGHGLLNIDRIVDKGNQGTRKDALLEMLYLVLGVMILMAILSGVAAIINANKPSLNV